MRYGAKWLGVGVLLVLCLGCEYTNEQEIRAYNEQLGPVRIEVALIEKYQPRLQDKKAASSCSAFVEKEVLSRSRRIVVLLSKIQPEQPRIVELHRELVEIWADYSTAYEDFVSDLEEHNLRHKKQGLQEALERQEGRLRWWNGEIRALHEAHL